MCPKYLGAAMTVARQGDGTAGLNRGKRTLHSARPDAGELLVFDGGPDFVSHLSAEEILRDCLHRSL